MKKGYQKGLVVFLGFILICCIVGLMALCILARINTEQWWLYIGLRYVVIFIAIAIALTIPIYSYKKALGKTLSNYSLVMAQVIIVFFLLEAAFMAIPESSQNSYAISAQIWYKYYWGQPNALGYRDKPIKQREDTGKRKIFVIGDSFAAGHGIKDTSQRFSNQLEHLLGAKENRVYNLGEEGSNTIQQYQNLLNYPIEPDAIILFHVNDDILSDSIMISFPLPAQQLSKPHRIFFETSFCYNYIFETYVAPGMFMNSIYENLKYNPLASYYNPDSLAKHQNNLQQFINYAEAKNIPLVVVVFPGLQHAFEFTSLFNRDVIAHFEAQNIPVYDTYHLLDTMSIKQRIVNNRDSHPSAYVNQLLAKEVFELYFKKP